LKGSKDILMGGIRKGYIGKGGTKKKNMKKKI